MTRSQAPIRNFIGTGNVAVAIDNDMNSRGALKWAADHILTPGHIFYLLHVRRNIGTIPTHGGSHLSINEVDDDVASTILDQHNSQTKELIFPFQIFCNRRGLQCKEVILDGIDVPKAIIDFIQHRSIDKLIMGACSRSANIRTFNNSDVPTAVCKAAPDYCCVYVISKRKISSFQPATLKNSTHPNTSYSCSFNPAQNHKGHGCMNEKTARENRIGISSSSQGPDHSISATFPTSQLTMRRSQAPIRNFIGTGNVAVAIDNDMNSRGALKWAADHILTPGHIFYLLHVRRNIGTIPTHGGSHLSINEVDDDVASTILDQHNSQTKELILPFQIFCNSRGLQCKEVILDGIDVPKAIIDFIQHRSIDKLIMGACSRSANIRTFNNSDVPTAVCKAAPDYCCIYVISKGKNIVEVPTGTVNEH